ncbi:hypothetical protein EBZ39_00070 [bacterium]|nr:hypothetical protein [bacterium]
MTSKTTSKTITPLDVWNAYPGSDLLAVDPPEEKENFQDYIKRVGADDLRNCGDTLFSFIMFECSDSDGEPEAIVYMMNNAIRDILSVKNLAERATA